MRRLWIAWTLLLLALAGCDGQSQTALQRLSSRGPWSLDSLDPMGRVIGTWSASFVTGGTYVVRRDAVLSPRCRITSGTSGRFIVSSTTIYFVTAREFASLTPMSDGDCAGVTLPPWFRLGERDLQPWETEYTLNPTATRLTMRVSPDDGPVELQSQF